MPVAVAVEECQASTRSAVAGVAFGSLGEAEHQVRLQGIAAERNRGIGCWDCGRIPLLDQGVVERSTIVEGVAGDKVVLEVRHEVALEGEEVAVVGVVSVVVVVVVVVAATYTAQALDHTVRSSHRKHPGLVLSYSVAEAGQEDKILDSRASSWGTSARSHTETVQSGAVCHAHSDRTPQDSRSEACSGHIAQYMGQKLKAHCS
jgi:hypothetical protein